MSYNAIDKYRETITKKKNELENKTYSQKALEALAKGNYASMRNNSKPVPSLKPTQKTQAKQNTSVNNTQTKQTTTTPKADDRNYVVKRDRYDKLMQDNRLANDIKTLAEVNYKNANQDATVSQEWADTIGAKNITGGYTKQQYLDTLSRRYSLTPKELNDMALTFHSDANKAETEAYGKGLEEAGKKLPVLGSLGSFVGTLGSGVEGAYNTLVGGITGDDRYLSNMFRTTKNSPREGVKQNINSNAGKTIYDIGMGVGDMIASAAAGSAPTLLAGNTANEAQASARERGSSVRKSSAYAGVAGALDFVTNKIGLDKAKDLAVSSIKSSGIKKMLAQGAAAGAGEAGENLIQDIGQSFFDTLINGKNSELLYSFDNKVANGMSGEDALKEVAKEYALQLGVSAATGFGMGAVMQGGKSIMNDPAGFKSELSKLQINNKGMADVDELGGKNPDIQAILRSKPGLDENAKVKDLLSPEDRASIFGGTRKGKRTQGLVDAVGYAKKFAGDTEEAKQLAKETKNLMETYVESGTLDDYITLLNKIDELDNLARDTRADYATKKGDVFTYDKYFTDFDEAGNEIPSSLLDAFVGNSALSKSVKAIHDARQPKADTTSAPLTESISDGNNQVMNKPNTSTTDYNGYKVGDKITYSTNDFDGKSSKDGVIKEVYPDHMIVDVPGVSDHVWIDSDSSDMVRPSSAPISNVEQIKEGIKAKDFKPVTFVNNEGHTYIVTKSTRPGEKWQLSHIDDTGRPIGHSAYSNDADILADIDKINNDNIANVGGDTIFNQGQTTIGDMLNNPDDYTLDDFQRAVRSYDKNADIDGAEIEDIIDFLSAEADNDPDFLTTKIAVNRLVDNGGNIDGQLTPKEVSILQDAVDGKYDIPETGNEIPTVKPTEPTTFERVPEVASENVPPRRSFFDDLPPRSDKEGKSKVGTNTMVNAKIFTEDQINNDPVISELNKYAKANNDRTFTAAKENVLKNGDALLDDYISGRKSLGNDLDVDQAMLLLKGLNDKISYGDTSLEAQRNLLFSKLRQTGTLYGQTIQAFKKWNDTPEGAVINGDRLLDKPTQTWKSNNKKKVELNGRIAKALEQMGMDNSMRNKPKVEKTHEQIRKGVENVLAREYGSVEKYFNDNDIEFLTTLAENKDIPVWQITDEIEHKMNTGTWYTLDESIPEPQGPVNQRLKNALDALVPREEVVKEPLTFNEIRDQVKNTFNREAASLEGEFDDRDIDYLANMIQDGATKQELAEALNTKLATGKFGISLDTQQKVNDLFEYANRYDPNSKQAIEAKSAAYKLIADEAVMDASPLEKFESWRYLAMLGNPKTMIRNYVGNKMFGAVTGASNNFSAMLEAGTDKLARKLGADGIQRTKAILNPLEDSDLIKAAGNDAEAHRYSQLEGTKYEKGTQNAIRKQKSVFNSKLIRLYERATDAGISDYNAVKKKYSTSLAGYMKANGLDQSAFDADETYRGLQDISKRRVLTNDERATMESYKGIHDQLEKARDYAVKQAEYATFHEDNAIAKFLTEQSQKARNSENGAVRGLGYMLEGLVPFKKTPANILKSGIDYSPLGAIKSIKETGKLIYENTGKRKGNLEDTYTKKNKLTGKEQEVNRSIAADVIDSWSKTLTGTGLLALGYYLKNKGILNSSNKDEKWQDDLEGIQNYSITINGKTYTLDWAAPAVMPLLMGAEMSKIKDRSAMLDTKWYDNLDAVGETVNALLDPMFETSMLQGIKDTVEQATKQIKYDDNAAIGGILGSLAMNTATGYLTQGLPTISGQIARTVDNTRRTTDTATSSPLLEPFEKQGRKIINKIPGLSMLNEAYYDSYGRTQQNGPFNNPIGNLLYQMGSPAYIRDINTTDADRQAREAYYGEGEDGKPIMDSKVFPTWKSTVKVEGQKLSPSEMATYRKTSGEAQYAIRDALSKEDWFKNLDASQQTEILGKVNTLVDKIGKGEAGYPQDSKDLQAYESGGVPSLLSYWNGKIESKRVTEETGLSANTNAVKEINQLLSEGQAEEAEKKIKQAKKDNEARLKLNEKYGVNIKMADYQRREEANPGSNEEWAKEHATKSVQTQTTPKVTTKSEPETNDTKVDTAGYEKYIDRAGSQSKKFTNDIPKLKELNYGKSEMYTYAYAINQDSSLTPQSFNAQYKKLDLDGNGSMKQDEMISYFNKNNTSEKQANYLWRTYGENKGTPWKTLPVLKNGTWKKSK